VLFDRRGGIIRMNLDGGSEEVEGAIRALAEEFVRQKPRLRGRWTSEQ